MENRIIKFNASMNNNITLRVVPGHFATSYSHINYYIDMTSLKTRQKEAAEVAKSISRSYGDAVVIDTIVCMDGCEVIGAFLAQELSSAGILNMNAHKTIYIISPEYNSNGQMIFRTNNQPALLGKHVLLLVASVTTGSTVRKSLESIQYYGGKIQGIASIFSVLDKIENVTVNTIFKEKDIPGYKNYAIGDCPFCKTGQKVEAIVNGHGYVKL